MGISDPDSRLLLADSGGFCANPGCGRELFRPLATGGVATVYDRAHVIARSKTGPRGKDEQMTDEERDSYANLLLLCTECHRVIDAHANDYPTSLLQKWKRDHRESVRSAVSAPVHATRALLNSDVSEALRTNKAIFDEFGPTPGGDPTALDAARMWHHYVVASIIPNNRRILSLIRRNTALLTNAELDVIERFRLHAEGLEFNHLSGDKNSAVPTFPLDLPPLFEQ